MRCALAGYICWYCQLAATGTLACLDRRNLSCSGEAGGPVAGGRVWPGLPGVRAANGEPATGPVMISISRAAIGIFRGHHPHEIQFGDEGCNPEKGAAAK